MANTKKLNDNINKMLLLRYRKKTLFLNFVLVENVASREKSQNTIFFLSLFLFCISIEIPEMQIRPWIFFNLKNVLSSLSFFINIH